MVKRQFVDLPTFLDDHYTLELATQVAERLRPLIEGMMDAGEVHRQALWMHFALARPERGLPWLATVYQVGFGREDCGEWEWSYDLIAPGKNAISGRTGQLSRVIQEFRRGQLVESDTEFWGNWMHWPILVSCSGVKPWFDTAFASAAGAMVLAELEQILDDEYGMTAKEAGLVTDDGSTLPVFADRPWVPERLKDLVVDEPGDDAGIGMPPQGYEAN